MQTGTALESPRAVAPFPEGAVPGQDSRSMKGAGLRLGGQVETSGLRRAQSHFPPAALSESHSEQQENSLLQGRGGACSHLSFPAGPGLTPTLFSSELLCLLGSLFDLRKENTQVRHP